MTAVAHRLADNTDFNLRSFWGGRVESAEEVARKTAATLQGLAGVFPVDGWRYAQGRVWRPWPATAVEQTAWVESQLSRAEDGLPEPEYGYSFALSQDVGGLFIELSIDAGGSIRGGRLPVNSAIVSAFETAPGGFTVAVVDPVVEAVLEVWEPLAANFHDDAVMDLARPTSSWQVPLGYRVWVHASVGAILEAAPGVLVSHRRTGTLLSAPDDWTTVQVVEAMGATLAMNNIDEVAHEK